MFDQISINQFKCFSKEQTIHLAPINVFYGKNGRGKSTVAQVFLLLGQTIQKGGASYLLLNGKMVRLGLFKDILSRNIEDDKLSFKFHLEEKNSDIIFEYQADQEKPTVGKLSRLEADGMNLMDFQTKAPGSGNEESQEVSLSAFSGHGLENFMNIYYVSASRRGQVNSEPRNDIDGKAIGTKGENVYNVLLAMNKEDREDVRKSLSEILDGATLGVKETAAHDEVELLLDSKDNGDSFRPVNVGFGYSYILPIIVNALVIPEGGVLIVENPEAHLFPAAQSKLMEFLIRTCKERNIQLIVESHSDHVVNGIRIAVKKGNLEPDDVVVDYFDRQGNGDVKVKDLHIDKNGQMNDYPDDFMDEWTRQLLELA